jgi:hypothetical protein
LRVLKKISQISKSPKEVSSGATRSFSPLQFLSTEAVKCRALNYKVNTPSDMK